MKEEERTKVEHLDLRRKVTIMIAVMASLLFAGLNQTILSTALPRIMILLKDGGEYYSWVITIYLLTSTVTGTIIGRLSDIYGRKPFLLVGLSVFIVGTLMCGFSANMYQLIIYRGIQGLGAGVIMSTAFTIIGDLFAPRERGRWQGMMAATFGVSSVFGPTLGGYIIDHMDWHWIFWVFLPLGFVALFLIMKLFPSVPKAEGESVDYVGSFFLTTMIVPLLLALSWAGSTYAWGSPFIIGLFTTAAVSLVIFILVELRVKSPILPMYLFKSSIFTVSMVSTFFVGGMMFGLAIYLPFFVQGALGASASASGYVMMPLTLSLVLSSAIGGQLISRTGKYKLLGILGMAFLVVGLFLLSTMSPDTSYGTVILYMILAGIGVGFNFTVLNLSAQNAVSNKMLGASTASLTLFRQLGGTLTISIFGLLLTRFMTDKAQETLGAASGQNALDPSALPQDTAAVLPELMNPQILMDPERLGEIQALFPEQLSAMFDQTVSMLREIYSYGLTQVFLIGVFIAVAGFITNLFLKEVPLREASRPAEEPTVSQETVS